MGKWLILILLFKAMVMFAVIAFAGIGLGPDEAQYWTWSQALDWGYYSKPPGIAWQIWLGTRLFGDTEWGVRSLTVCMAIAQAYAVYILARSAALLDRSAFWCALFMALSPLGIAGSLFAITDAGFLLCWTGACIPIVKALQEEKELSFIRLGLWILVGALFKWPIYLLWVFVVVNRSLFIPQLKIQSLLIGISISLVGLLPSVWWNLSHDWATFRHVFATVQGGSSHRAGGNLLEFIGAQALLLSPILFLLLIGALWQWARMGKKLPPPLYFCGFITITALCVATLLSSFQKVQGNWVVFAYPTGLVVLGWYAFELRRTMSNWARGGVAFSLLLVAAFILFPAFQSIPYRFHPLKHNTGWRELGTQLEEHGYDPQKHFLVADKYQISSLLSFYGQGQRRAYFLNLQGMRNNQFSYWPSIQEEQKGKSGFFVWVENSPRLEKNQESKREFYLQELQAVFEKIEFVGLVPLIKEEENCVKGALIFKCERCKDFSSITSSRY